MSADSLSPQIVSRVLAEIRQLVKNPVDGIEFIENENNSLSEIHCFINGPAETPYIGGKFRVKLVLGEEYPAVPPRGYFLTKIYHPNISNTGDICVNTLKRDWKPEVTISHIFQVIRCLLIIPFPESSLNDEAGKLFMESFEEFSRRARIMTSVHAIQAVPVEGIKKLPDDDIQASVGDENSHQNGVPAALKTVRDAKKKTLKRL